MAVDRRTVCVLHREDFSAWRHRYALGEAAGALPYGMEALEDRFEILHPDIALPSLARAIVQSLEYRTDRKVGQVVTSIGSLRGSDACLSIFEDFGLGLLPLARFVRVPPLVLMSCWMSQRLLTFAHRQRTDFSRLVDLATAVTVFSANQIPLMAALLGVRESKLHVVPFGVVTDYFVPGSGEGGDRDNYVAVVGQDVGRDWPTFFRAAARTPRIRFVLAAPSNQMGVYSPPENVEVLGKQPPSRYRALLQGADFVVVVSHPLPYPTGQSVLLEAMSCGRPAVVTRSPAMREYVQNDAVATCEAGDADGLAAMIAALAADKDRRSAMASVARPIVLERFDSRQMWATVGAIIESAI
jgi:glycosyltransferase involved in cell wall biosynthesis